MRGMWRALAGVVCLAAMTQVSSATSLTLTGTGGQTENAGSETVYVYPYDFSVNGSSATTQLMCLSFNDEVTQGESWTVNVESLPQTVSYEEEAWLYSQITPGSTATQVADIQFAAWEILDSSAPSSDPGSFWVTNASGIQDEINDAAANYGSVNLSDFVLYVPNQDPGYYTAQNGYPDGVPQTFIGTAAAPEPGSLALLGTGLLGMGGAVRRRMRRA